MEDLVQVAVRGAYNRHWDKRDLLSQGFHPLFHVEHLLLCVEPLLDFLPQLQFCFWFLAFSSSSSSSLMPSRRRRAIWVFFFDACLI
jgi:hypothetical protein